MRYCSVTAKSRPQAAPIRRLGIKSPLETDNPKVQHANKK